MRGFLRLSLVATVFCRALGLAATAQDPPGPSPAARELAARLIGASEAEWREFLARNPERIDLDLRRGFAVEANRLMSQQRFGDARHGYELARQVAEKIGDRRGAAAALAGIGTIRGRQGDYKEAAQFLREGLAISESINDRQGTADVLVDMATVLRLQGDRPAALEAARRAARLAA